MKRIGLFTISFFLCAYTLFAQSRPMWLDDDLRTMQYPSNTFLVGFAYGSILSGESFAQATERIKNAAQANLLENVRINMKSSTSSIISSEAINGQYYESEKFINQTFKDTFAEIVGMKNESYFDKTANTVYVFTYAKRVEVVNYHKNIIQFNLSRIEGLLNAAENLSAQNDNASARTNCSEALSYFPLIEESQSLLIALGGKSGDIQQERANGLRKVALEIQSLLDPKYEILASLGNELTQKLMQAESILEICNEFYIMGEKGKAKEQCELVQSLIPDVLGIQESIRKADPSASVETLKQQRVDYILKEIKVLSAQLAQAILIQVDSNENEFGKQVSIISSKIKSQLASNGCSFTDDMSKADFKLTLVSDIVEGSTNESFVFCYANVSIDFYDTHKNKSVYCDDINEKGGGTTKEKAARKAMENAANKILERIVLFLK